MDMSDSELLIQRFVDQDLSSDERVRFLSRLGRDEDLRQRVIDLEQLSADASRLPDVVVPDGFVARVMSRTSATEPAWRRAPTATRARGWMRSILAPRVVRWNVATAGACAALLIVVGLVAGRQIQPPAVQVAPAREGSLPAPASVLVRLVVVQPMAAVVHVAGDFNGWNPSRTPLQPIAGGAWSVTIPLAPGRYEYMFVVDNAQWIADPFAPEQTDDGFGSRNAVLDVRDPTTRDVTSRAGMRETL